MNTVQKAKLTWRCRRGMLELDLILGRFLTNHLEQMTLDELTEIEHLLTYPDPDLFSWLMGQECPSDERLINSVKLIQLHAHIKAL